MTKRKVLPNRSLLLELFVYDKEKGTLIWKPHYWCPNRFSGKVAGSFDRKGYRKIKMRCGSYYRHRLIWKIEKETEPEIIDHINGIPSDDRIENLRDVTHRVNQQNRAEHRTGHLVGTSFYAGKWSSFIRIDGRQKYLGRYDTMREAHQTYLDASGE